MGPIILLIFILASPMLMLLFRDFTFGCCDFYEGLKPKPKAPPPPPPLPLYSGGGHDGG